MTTTDNRTSMQQRAIDFSSKWRDPPYCKVQHTEYFLRKLFGIWGVCVEAGYAFNRRVKIGEISHYIEYILDGVLLVEQTDTGMSLNDAYKKALSYIPGLKPEVVPRYIMVCDFNTFRLYDRNPQDSRDSEYIEFILEKLHENIDLFNFLIGVDKKINKQLFKTNGILFDALHKVYKSSNRPIKNII